MLKLHETITRDMSVYGLSAPFKTHFSPLNRKNDSTIGWKMQGIGQSVEVDSGALLPVWIGEDGQEIVVMDSIEKLEKLSGLKVFDLHWHNIDHITIPSSRGPQFGVLFDVLMMRLIVGSRVVPCLMLISTILLRMLNFLRKTCG